MKGKETGIVAALVGNIFISYGRLIQKKAHNSNQDTDGPKIPFVRLPLWWIGTVVMVMGEAGNFVAYGCAPASVVTPLGACSVVVNAILAARVLGERLTTRNIIGCVVCVVGGTSLVLASPPQSQVLSVTGLEARLQDTAVVVYVVSLMGGIVGLLAASQTFGIHRRSVVVYVAVCSLFGAFTVMSTKALATVLQRTLGGENELTHPLTLVLVLVVIISTVSSVWYLNKAMEVFGISEVVPVYYVMFTLASIVSAAVLYNEFALMAPASALAFIAAVAFTAVGVALISHQRSQPSKPSGR